MKVRFGLLLTTALALAAGGCASAGTGGGGGGAEGEQNYPPRETSETNTAQLYLSQAQTATDDAVAEQRYEQALEAANEGIQADSLNPLSYYHAALALVMLDRDYDRADRLLDQALELYPPFEPELEPVREQAWINLYNAAIEPLNQGNLEEAARIFQQANDMYDRRPEAFLNLASVYAQMGQPEQAAEAFRDAIEAAQERQGVLSELIAQGDTANLAAQQAQLEGARQNETLARENLAQVLRQLERYNEAARVYEEHLDQNPDDLQALATYAAILTEAQRPDSAEAIYENLLNQPGLSSVEYISVGVGLYQAEQWNRSAEAFNMALDENPRDGEAAAYLAQARFAGENWEALIDATEAALELLPRDGILYKIRARAFAETNDPETGGAVLDEYQDLDFEIQGLQLTPRVGRQGGAVNGVLTNRSVEQGEPIVLRFHFTDPEGSEITTEEVTISAPGPNETAQVRVEVDTGDRTLGGYWYEVVEP